MNRIVSVIKRHWLLLVVIIIILYLLTTLKVPS